VQQIGAVSWKKTVKEQEEYTWHQLGMAFQLMDDYLDAFGDPGNF
jgi:geranylgeranyl pyrophosphate synthase